MAHTTTYLRRTIASGEYAIDPRAVAEAMLRRFQRVASGSTRDMPVTGDPIDRLAVRSAQDDTRARRDAA
jgi:hypothetical protein